MTVFVRYVVPVLAEVDLVASRVVRVQVDDEAVRDADMAFDVDGSSLSDEIRTVATRVAEVEPWPAWESGMG